MAFRKREKPDNEAPQTAEPENEYQLPAERYDVGERPPKTDMVAHRKWRKRVKKARRQLRQELKEKGIRSRSDFEQIAWEMGLGLDENRRGILWWLRWRLRWLKSHFGIGSLMAAAGVLLSCLFLMGYVSDHAGAFTINLTSEMLENGFVLAESPTFEKPTSRLFSERTKDLNNITLEDIAADVDNVDGAHNGKNYVAYTYYIKNCGDTVQAYRYALQVASSSLGVNDAVWIMLFEDGKQVIYANSSADGDAEGILGYQSKPPFYALAYDPDSQYYQKDGSWGIRTTAFAAGDVVVYGYVDNVQPEEVHRYTVVIWLEGNDPECTDEIFGGHATYSMEFNVDDETSRRNIFTGVWRTEYEDYADYAAAELVTLTPD